MMMMMVIIFIKIAKIAQYRISPMNDEMNCVCFAVNCSTQGSDFSTKADALIFIRCVMFFQ